jgi:hypothetical protein
VERESTHGVWLIFFMTPTLFAFAKLDGAALGEDDLMAFPRHGSIE